LQSPKPLAQANPQTPLAQVAVAWAGAAQAWPQVPQLFGSVFRSRQLELQQVWLPGQVPVEPQPQLPFTQLSPAWQAWPQVPQLFGSVFRLTSQPSLAV
jgi:hypothetical protein